MEFFSQRVSSLRSAANVKYEPRDIYYLYKDEFGFPPKKANHLVQFAKQKDYVLKLIKAEELLNDPPNPPKRKLANGAYDWGFYDTSSEEDDDDQDDAKTSIASTKKHEAVANTNHTDFDKLKRTQVIPIAKYISSINITHVDSNKTDITENTLYDESGYYLLPFTKHIIFDFHLDFATKHWPKTSRTFLHALNDTLGIKRKDYNIITINKHENSKQETQISLLIRKFNKEWPNYEDKADIFKRKTDETLSPLKKTFRDSGHLLKMLKKLQFHDIDTSGNNQVDRTEFDAYFSANSVEPLDPQVLTNLFDTLDEDGDGEITALEFFKWKTSFSATKLTQMFPIVDYKICDFYGNFGIPQIKSQLFELQQHCYQRMQDFPFQVDIQHMFHVNHYDKYKKFGSIKGFQQAKMLFLVHKKGVGDYDINTLLKNAIHKKGKYFDEKGIYGQGYYFTSHFPYALKDIFYGETSEFDENATMNEEEAHHLMQIKGHKAQLSTMDKSQSEDLSHGEYTVMICLVNPGKINYIKDFERAKKIKSADSNCVQRIIGDWDKEELFGKPESHYYDDNDDSNSYYTGDVYDCYVVKSHERILPQYILTIKRVKQCFIWIDEKYDQIKQSANRLIDARSRFKSFLPNIIYGGSTENMQNVIKMIRLKMRYNSVFLLRFVGIDVNVNRTTSAFIKYIKGNIEQINIKIYPITIIYNVNTQKQLWNLILREQQNKPFANVCGSAKQIFKYIRDHLGGNKTIKRVSRNKGYMSIIVISIQFIKYDKQIKEIMIQQIEDAKYLEKECENDPIYDPQSRDIYAGAFQNNDESEEKKGGETKSKFTIQVTGANGDTANAQKSKKKDPLQQLLDDEKIDKLIALDLPEEVGEYLGSSKAIGAKLPNDEELMQELERDMRKMHQGLHGQSENQRKYSKLAVLKHYDALYAIYDKYCKLGGDRHWLTIEGFMWMLNDAMIPNKKLNDETLIELFQITYKMHHRLQTRHKSKHKIQLSAMYGNESFHDDDPWSGVWKRSEPQDSQHLRTKSRARPSKKTEKEDIYKLRKIGDLRLSGCIGDISYAHISGKYHSLDYRKAELEIKYHQRNRAGIKRIWNAELIPPENILDCIRMKVDWTEINTKYKAAKAKSGELHLEKISALKDNDSDLPKDQMIGLSRYEFFDLILSIASTKFGMDFEYQFICVEKLLSDHMDAYIYPVIENENLHLMSNNEVKKQVRSKQSEFRKLFKYYASLDSDEKADDDGLGMEEWCTFAMESCKVMKSLNKKIWKQGGQPSFEDMKASFILSKTDHALDEMEVDYLHFEKCIVNLINYMFKPHPKPKYKILSFEEKLKILFKASDRMVKTKLNVQRDSTMLKKIKLKSTMGLTDRASANTPRTPVTPATPK